MLPSTVHHPHHGDTTREERMAILQTAIARAKRNNSRFTTGEYLISCVAGYYADAMKKKTRGGDGIRLNGGVPSWKLHETDATFAAHRLMSIGDDDAPSMRDLLAEWRPCRFRQAIQRDVLNVYVVKHCLTEQEMADIYNHPDPTIPDHVLFTDFPDHDEQDREDSRELNLILHEEWTRIRVLLGEQLTRIDVAESKRLESGAFALLTEVVLDDIVRTIIAPYLTPVKLTPIKPPEECKRTRSGTKRMRDEEATKHIFVPRARHRE